MLRILSQIFGHLTIRSLPVSDAKRIVAVHKKAVAIFEVNGLLRGSRSLSGFIASKGRDFKRCDKPPAPFAERLKLISRLQGPTLQVQDGHPLLLVATAPGICEQNRIDLFQLLLLVDDVTPWSRGVFHLRYAAEANQTLRQKSFDIVSHRCRSSFCRARGDDEYSSSSMLKFDVNHISSADLLNAIYSMYFKALKGIINIAHETFSRMIPRVGWNQLPALFAAQFPKICPRRGPTDQVRDRHPRLCSFRALSISDQNRVDFAQLIWRKRNCCAF